MRFHFSIVLLFVQVFCDLRNFLNKLTISPFLMVLEKGFWGIVHHSGITRSLFRKINGVKIPLYYYTRIGCPDNKIPRKKITLKKIIFQSFNSWQNFLFLIVILDINQIAFKMWWYFNVDIYWFIQWRYELFESAM